MKVYIEIEVPDNFETCLSMQPMIEAEIKADRWAWFPADLIEIKDDTKEDIRQYKI